MWRCYMQACLWRLTKMKHHEALKSCQRTIKACASGPQNLMGKAALPTMFSRRALAAEQHGKTHARWCCSIESQSCMSCRIFDLDSATNAVLLHASSTCDLTNWPHLGHAEHGLLATPRNAICDQPLIADRNLHEDFPEI